MARTNFLILETGIVTQLFYFKVLNISAFLCFNLSLLSTVLIVKRLRKPTSSISAILSLINLNLHEWEVMFCCGNGSKAHSS